MTPYVDNNSDDMIDFLRTKNMLKNKKKNKENANQTRVASREALLFEESWAGLSASYVESSEESNTRIFCSLKRLL